MQVGARRDGLRPIIRIVVNLFLFLFGGAGMFAGYSLGGTFAPRNDAIQMTAAAAGLAIGVLIWYAPMRWIENALGRRQPPIA